MSELGQLGVQVLAQQSGGLVLNGSTVYPEFPRPAASPDAN